ncbi:hypothetical protein [Fretibacter rubidus]|uniref:hypothetical protein n=1 Tax=Fretibacter rubidus TaxID=570162 RepID=UPI00352A5C55
MKPEQWTDIFTLLAIIVVADDRVYKEEVDSFVAQVDILKSEVGSDALVTPKLAFDWFVAQRDEIKARVQQENAEFFIVRTIQGLLDFPNHGALLRSMEAVSVSDREFHIEEKSIIQLAAAYWGQTPPY